MEWEVKLESPFVQASGCDDQMPDLVWKSVIFLA